MSDVCVRVIVDRGWDIADWFANTFTLHPGTKEEEGDDSQSEKLPRWTS